MKRIFLCSTGGPCGFDIWTQPSSQHLVTLSLTGSLTPEKQVCLDLIKHDSVENPGTWQRSFFTPSEFMEHLPCYWGKKKKKKEEELQGLNKVEDI